MFPLGILVWYLLLMKYYYFPRITYLLLSSKLCMDQCGVHQKLCQNKTYIDSFISEMTYVPLVVNTFRSVLHSWIITGFVTRLTRRVPLVVQELLILPQHLSSPPVCSGVRVTRSLVLCVFFVDRYLYFCTVSFGHCVVCSSIYGFWIPLWYRQTLPISTFLFLNCHIYIKCHYFVFTILIN
jgi:hypothetical protein